MNKNKKLSPIINYNGKRIERIPVQTRILTSEDNIAQVIREYALPLMQQGDILTISESPLAITQGRAIPVEKIKPGRLAQFLSSKLCRVFMV
jgi:F420-0:gamma-glutamyl ligase